MKKRFYFILVIMVLSVVGCQKDPIQEMDISDQVTNSAKYEGIKQYILSDPFLSYFFYGDSSFLNSKTEGRSVDELLERIKLELAAQDKKNKFLKNLSAKYGFVLWGNVTRNQNENPDKVLYFLPMAKKEQDQLSAVILAAIDGDVITFNLVTKNQVNQFLPISKGKEKWENLPAMTLYFLKFDKVLFGLLNPDYEKWLKAYNGRKFNEVEDRSYYSFTYCEEICERWAQAMTGDSPSTVPGYVSDRSIPGCAESYTYCTTVFIYTNDCWYCGGGTTETSTAGGSSGTNSTDIYGSTSTSSTALINEAKTKHQELMDKYPDYAAEGVNINFYLIEDKVEEYLAAATFYEAYVQEVNIIPTDPYLWQLMWEEFREELGPIALELIPVIGDIYGAYDNFSQGKFWGGCLNIAALIPISKVGKVASFAPEIKRGCQVMSKLARIFMNLADAPRFQKVLNRLPQAWKDLPGSKLADGEGLKWVMPNNGPHFRLMDANPNGWPSQQVPYGKFWKNGSFKDINGNPVSSDSPAAHIPLSSLTDTFLNNYFNN